MFKIVCNVLNDGDIDKSEVDDIVLVVVQQEFHINNMLKNFWR